MNYVGAELLCEKIGIPSKITKKKTKTRIGNSTGNADKNLRKQPKMTKKRKDAGICRNKKEKAAQEKKITIQLEEINQKVLAKEGRLKRYRQRVKKYRQNRTFQTAKENFINNLEEMTRKQPDAKGTERFWTEIWQPKTQ